MKSVQQEYDELKGWKRFTHWLWCRQHMLRVNLYRLTGFTLRYRWARRIGKINMVPLVNYAVNDAEMTYKFYQHFQKTDGCAEVQK